VGEQSFFLYAAASIYGLYPFVATVYPDG